MKDYLSCLLLDFVLVDPALEAIPFGWAFQLAEDLGLKQHFEEIVKRELRFSDKKLLQYKQKVLAAFYEVKEGATEQVYED